MGLRLFTKKTAYDMFLQFWVYRRIECAILKWYIIISTIKYQNIKIENYYFWPDNWRKPHSNHGVI